MLQYLAECFASPCVFLSTSFVPAFQPPHTVQYFPQNKGCSQMNDGGHLLNMRPPLAAAPLRTCTAVDQNCSLYEFIIAYCSRCLCSKLAQHYSVCCTFSSSIWTPTIRFPSHYITLTKKDGRPAWQNEINSYSINPPSVCFTASQIMEKKIFFVSLNSVVVNDRFD